MSGEDRGEASDLTFLSVLDAGEPLKSHATGIKRAGMPHCRVTALNQETFICCTIKDHLMLPHQSRSLCLLRPQLWPCCCRCVLSSSSSSSWGGGGQGSSSPEEDARSSPVDAVRRKITGIWARAGLVSCRPWIHLASVAWSWAPAIHMAKTGPSSTVGRDRPSVCAAGL